jgi:pentatricopeptide repeat protein
VQWQLPLLISVCCGFSGHRQTHNILISNPRRQGRDFGSTTNWTSPGWKQRWLHCHHELYDCTSFHGMQGLPDMSRLDNVSKEWTFFSKTRRGHDSWQIHFCSSLNAFAGLQALEEGKHVHRLIREHGFESDVYVGCNLIDMCAKCGSIEDAWRVFNSMPVCDVFTWSVIIMQFAKCGWGLKALELFEQMWQEGVDPNPVAFAGALNACASVAALRSGQTCSWTCNSRWLWVWWLSAL